jgi:hypothetical protein
MSSLTLATFFFLRHLPDASGRGIGKPVRTTNRSRLSFRYTSNILRPPADRQNIAGSRNGNNSARPHGQASRYRLRWMTCRARRRRRGELSPRSSGAATSDHCAVNRHPLGRIGRLSKMLDMAGHERFLNAPFSQHCIVTCYIRLLGI